MRRTISISALAVALTLGAVLPASAFRSCADGQRRIDEASALRHQARQEARLGDHDRYCDTLDEVGDRFKDAQDAFEDCDASVMAIDLRSELRAVRMAKRANHC